MSTCSLNSSKGKKSCSTHCYLNVIAANVNLRKELFCWTVVSLNFSSSSTHMNRDRITRRSNDVALFRPLRNWLYIPKCKTPRRAAAADWAPRGRRWSKRRTRTSHRGQSTWAPAASSSLISRATSAPWWTNTSAERWATARCILHRAATRA